MSFPCNPDQVTNLPVIPRITTSHKLPDGIVVDKIFHGMYYTLATCDAISDILWFRVLVAYIATLLPRMTQTSRRRY